MRTVLLLVTLPIVALLLFCVGGYYYLESLPSVKQAPEVPIWQTGPLRPLDYRKLSEGKITRYILNGNNPHSPTQEAMLEACRELPIKNATARSAFVVIKCRYGELPISALVVNKTTVLIEVSGVVRALYISVGLGMPEILYDKVSITLTPKSKWAVVGKKRIPLHMAYYWAHNGYRVMTLQDLQAVFHERDIQIGDHTIQSVEVSYEPDASKLYKAAP